MKIRAYFMLVMVLYLGYGMACGQDFVELHNGDENVVLNAHAYLFQGNAGVNDIGQLTSAAETQFKKNRYFQEVNYNFDKSYGWCRFTVKNESDDTTWVLRIQQARVDSVQVFIVGDNHALKRLPLTGHFQKMYERPFQALNFAHQVSIAKGETVTFYLYTQRQFGRHALILNLQRERYFGDYEQRLTMGVSFVTGVTFLAALVGLILYFFVSDRIYLYYSIYCVSFLVLILANTGFMHAYISHERYQPVINTFNSIFYYWIVGWHILFTIALLNIKTYRLQWVYWLGRFSGVLFCSLSVALMFPALPDSIRWWTIYFSYFIVFFFDAYFLFILVVSLKQRTPVAYFYLAGFLITIIVASILMLADLQIIDGINQSTDWYVFTPMIEILCMVVGLGFHFSRNIKEKFRVQLALNKTQSQIITIQEDERKRIAQDLHDDVGNSLAAIRHMVIQKRDTGIIEKEIHGIIDNIRGISHNLMPVDFKEYTLANIVRQTVDKLNDHPTINFEYDYTGEITKIDPLTELVIYRIINELINNIIRHANATAALIQLIYRKESLVVMVEDNGAGINNTRTGNTKGLGLRSIQLRAEYIRAKLNFESDDRGTLVILELPYETI